MSENVTVFGDIADKFDALVAYDEKALDEWVEESGYSLGSMVTASTLMAFMTFAKGFVDVLAKPYVAATISELVDRVLSGAFRTVASKAA